jgi:hypothetical protein
MRALSSTPIEGCSAHCSRTAEAAHRLMLCTARRSVRGGRGRPVGPACVGHCSRRHGRRRCFAEGFRCSCSDRTCCTSNKRIMLHGHRYPVQAQPDGPRQASDARLGRHPQVASMMRRVTELCSGRRSLTTAGQRSGFCGGHADFPPYAPFSPWWVWWWAGVAMSGTGALTARLVCSHVWAWVWRAVGRGWVGEESLALKSGRRPGRGWAVLVSRARQGR